MGDDLAWDTDAGTVYVVVRRFAKRFAVFTLRFSSEVLTSVLSCHAVMTDSTTVRPPNGGILPLSVQCCRCNGNGSCQNCLCLKANRLCTSCTPGNKPKCRNRTVTVPTGEELQFQISIALASASVPDVTTVT